MMLERWYEAASSRFAVRKYRGAPNSKDIADLKKQAASLSAHGVRIAIATDDKAFASILLGSGKVKGTNVFAAFISEEAEPSSVGYLGEAFVLECTAMGLGTCWLGMYNKRNVASAVRLKKGEKLTCITPIGIPDERYTARPRKPLDKLTGLNQEQLQNLPEWQQYALECARRAPSATNAQPWSFDVDGDNMRVICISSNFGFGELDCGIAMLHLELGAAHGGVVGEWVFDDDGAIFKPTSFNN